jgi:polysaccharide deacetylase 2 family uncharacterized protein YibQ
MADTIGQPDTRNREGWRFLGLFWLTLLGALATCAGVVEWLGPPAPSPRQASAGKPPQPVHPVVAVQPARPPAEIHATELAPPLVAGRDTPGPIADPDPSLLEPLAQAQVEPTSGASSRNLPRIAADGRTAMQVYAAGFDYTSRRPRIGLLLAGIGMNEAESAAAIRGLPGAVSLAVSPYAATNAIALKRLLASARTTGHEYLIAIPLEPTSFPLNDPGPSALLTSATPADNARNLDWALSRIEGYVGATGVIGTMRGERLAGVTDQMEAVLTELAARGLLYVDPREGRGPVDKTWGRHIDLVVDDPADQGVADRTMIDARLAALEQLAKDTGSALGLVMRPTPVAVARIAAWSVGVADRGLALAPVSALALAPADQPSTNGMVNMLEHGE